MGRCKSSDKQRRVQRQLLQKLFFLDFCLKTCNENPLVRTYLLLVCITQKNVCCSVVVFAVWESSGKKKTVSTHTILRCVEGICEKNGIFVCLGYLSYT